MANTVCEHAVMRILIADDHELMRRGIRSLLLARPGYIVCGEAKDGREAVAKAKQLHPDIVLLDVTMPELNGLEAARLIRGESPRTHILILSQHDSHSMLGKALEAGARGYVCKSEAVSGLISALENIEREVGMKGSTA
jgi:DNA-binding NarL/FixJ family response regulator